MGQKCHICPEDGVGERPRRFCICSVNGRFKPLCSSSGTKGVFGLGSSVKSVQQQDAGQYWCEVEFHGITVSSESAWITVEGKDLEGP